jgi:hypothetical protein
MPDNERAGETSIKRELGGLEERGGGFVEAVEQSRMPMLILDPGARLPHHLREPRLPGDAGSQAGRSDRA